MTASPRFVKAALQDYLSGKTLKAMLVKDTYVQVPDTDDFVSDVVAFEVSASGYSRQTLTGVDVLINSDTGEVYIMCDDVNFGTFTAANVLGPIFYIDGASDADRRIISCATDGDGNIDITPTVSAIYRIDPDQGIFLGQTQ